MSTIKVMCRETGKELSGRESLYQRLTDCLYFPKGLLVGRRGYGADILSILDKNMTASLTMDVFMVVTEAIGHEDSGLPDFKLEQMGITSIGENHLELVVSGDWAPNGETVTLEGVRVGGN